MLSGQNKLRNSWKTKSKSVEKHDWCNFLVRKNRKQKRKTKIHFHTVRHTRILPKNHKRTFWKSTNLCKNSHHNKKRWTKCNKTCQKILTFSQKWNLDKIKNLKQFWRNNGQLWRSRSLWTSGPIHFKRTQKRSSKRRRRSLSWWWPHHCKTWKWPYFRTA